MDDDDSMETDLDALKRTLLEQQCQHRLELCSFQLTSQSSRYLLNQAWKERCTWVEKITFRECTFCWEEDQQQDDMVWTLAQFFRCCASHLHCLEASGGLLLTPQENNSNLSSLSTHQQQQRNATSILLRSLQTQKKVDDHYEDDDDKMPAVPQQPQNGIHKLCLRWRNHCGADAGRDLASALVSPCTRIDHLILIAPQLDQQTTQGFTSIFSSTTTSSVSSHLTQLTINFATKEQEMLEAIVPCILCLQSLRKLKFIDTELPPSALPFLSVLLEQHASLTSLELFQTHALFCRSLHHEEAFQRARPMIHEFAIALGQSCNLTHLSLCQSGISSRVLTYLLQWASGSRSSNTVSGFSCPLEYLDLTLNPLERLGDDDDNMASYWPKHLESFPNLIHLDLPSICQPNSSSAIKHFTNHLARSTSLQQLCFGNSTCCHLSFEIGAILKRNHLLHLVKQWHLKTIVTAKGGEATMSIWPSLLTHLGGNPSADMSPVFLFLRQQIPELLSSPTSTPMS